MMKTSHLICLFLLVCVSDFCKGRRRRRRDPPALPAAPPPEITNAVNAIHEMGQQIKRFTEQSTIHFRAMGTSINDVLKIMSQTTARGINLMEEEVKEMKEHTSAQLNAMTKNVEAIYSQFLQRVVNVEDAVQHVNTVIKRSRTGLEIGILILVLLVYLVARHLRLHTESDVVSRGGVVILSFIEIVFLIYALQLSANILHRHLTGEDIDSEELLRLAIGTASLIVSIMLILAALNVVSTWVLPFLFWSIKASMITLRNLVARLRWAFLPMCMFVISVYLYHFPSTIDQFTKSAI